MESISNSLDAETVRGLLGIHHSVALTHDEMIAQLRVCFFPTPNLSERLNNFLQKMKAGLEGLGIRTMSFSEALEQGCNGKVDKRVVIIATEPFTEGNLPTDYVSSLSENIIVGIYEGSGPHDQYLSPQSRIDTVIQQMVWDIVQVVIYVDQDTWTVCNMNGAIVPCSNRGDIRSAIKETLLSKIAAPVVPPRSKDFEIRSGAFDPGAECSLASVNDIVACGPIWEQTGLFIYQTALSSLAFRNKFYRRLGTAFVDHRTGMSYGFLARQMPQRISPAFTIEEANQSLAPLDWQSNGIHVLNDNWYVSIPFGKRRWVIPIPDVWVLSTRSGCSKTRLNPNKDIVRMCLSRGQFILETPHGLEEGSDCKPSYDTGVIFAHALGNALICSLLARLDSTSPFLAAFQTRGLALAHWHGYLRAHQIPNGWSVFGASNIPFACSTPQSAILALQGKLEAFEMKHCRGEEYHGDVHVEPHHGTNMTGFSLVEIGNWLLALQHT